jgi:cholesterol transport system auxiliary component
MKRALLPFAALLVPACAGLQAPPVQPMSTYLLEAQPAAVRAVPRGDLALAVSMPRARPGFDTAQMAYLRRAHELQYFASNRWAAAPAQMLGPQITQALERSGAWRSVVHNPSAASANLRLDSELVRLVQDFTTQPSRVRITLRAELIETASGRVLGAREFDEVETAPSDDPYGGVLAANRGLARLLGKLAEFAMGAKPAAAGPGMAR